MTTGTGRAAPPKATEVEVHGVEPIPDAERTAGPLDLFRLVFGGANTIATLLFMALGAWVDKRTQAWKLP